MSVEGSGVEKISLWERFKRSKRIDQCLYVLGILSVIVMLIGFIGMGLQPDRGPRQELKRRPEATVALP
jgi:hypothetical protein